MAHLVDGLDLARLIQGLEPLFVKGSQLLGHNGINPRPLVQPLPCIRSLLWESPWDATHASDSTSKDNLIGRQPCRPREVMQQLDRSRERLDPIDMVILVHPPQKLLEGLASHLSTAIGTMVVGLGVNLP